MKTSAKNAVKLGALVFTGIVLFIAGIYFIGRKQQMFTSTFTVSAIFRDINGLQAGDNVRYAGINVGIVQGIEQVADSSVRVDMSVRSQTRKFIRKNARASISSDGLMGSKILVIMPGSRDSGVIEDGDVILATKPVSTDEIMQKLAVTVDNAVQITGDLADITQNITEGRGVVGKLFTDTALAENMDKAIVNIKQGAGGFKRNMDAASHNILIRGYIKRQQRKAARKKDR